jgi:hypothetical protein
VGEGKRIKIKPNVRLLQYFPYPEHLTYIVTSR